MTHLPQPAHLPTSAIVGRLFREHIRAYVGQMLFAVFMMALVAATTAAYAWLVQPILDEIFIAKENSKLVAITVAVIVVFAVKGLADYSQTVIMARVSMRIVADIRQRVYESLIRADLAFFHGTSTGELIAGCMNNVDLMRDAVANTLTAMAKNVLTLVFLVALMFRQDWGLALVASFVFPLAIVPVTSIGRKVRKRASRAWSELETVTGFMSETFRGIRHISAWDDFHGLRNPAFEMPPGLMGTRGFREGFSVLEPMGLTFDAWLYHPQIDDLTALARAFPATQIVINHAGGPLGIGPYAGRRDEVFKTWSTAIRGLAQCPNVHAKLGGLGMKLNGFGFEDKPAPPSSDELATAWKPYVETCIEAFGVARCMFESNFPVDKGSYSYPVFWNACKKLAKGASAAETADLFAGTAARFYRLTPPG